jgi:tRNA1(Val) A37 N6-methylase TrmN6
LLAPNRDGWLIDAGCGAGIFASAILDESGSEGLSLRYLGIEVDPILTLCSATTLDLIGAPRSWKVLFGNFLSLDQEYLRKIGFSGISRIISNPPYVRFHRIRGKRNLIATMKRRTGITLSGYSGMHSFFLAQSSALIGDHGKMVFVLPPEVDFINHSSLVLEELSGRFEVKKYATKEDLTVFRFQSRTQTSNPPLEPTGTRVARLHLMDIANVRRGISTGANSYFALTDQMVEKWDIPEKWRTRIIPTKIRLPEQVFGEREWNELRETGWPCWLLKIPRDSTLEQLPMAVKDYIRFGEKDGINLRPTCKFREPWYCVPVTATPDIVFTYMFRERPRFIYNQARAHVLTNLLSLVLKVQHTPGETAMRDLSNLLTENLVAWIGQTGAGRRYAGGLVKFEPGDLRNMPISSEVLSVLTLPRS